MFAKHDELLDDVETHAAVSRYIGDTFLNHLAAKWDIRDDDPSFAFHELPIIVEQETGHTIGCPNTLATTAIHRQRADFLSTILSNHVERLATPP